MFRTPDKPWMVNGNRKAYDDSSTAFEEKGLRMMAPIEVDKKKKTRSAKSLKKYESNMLQQHIRVVNQARVESCREKKIRDGIAVDVLYESSTNNDRIKGRIQYRQKLLKRAQVINKSEMKSVREIEIPLNPPFVSTTKFKGSHTITHASQNTKQPSYYRFKETKDNEYINQVGDKVLYNNHDTSVDNNTRECPDAYIDSLKGLKMKICLKRKQEHVNYASENVDLNNGIKLKILLKRKCEDDANTVSAVHTFDNRSPLNTPLSKKLKLSTLQSANLYSEK